MEINSILTMLWIVCSLFIYRYGFALGSIYSIGLTYFSFIVVLIIGLLDGVGLHNGDVSTAVRLLLCLFLATLVSCVIVPVSLFTGFLLKILMSFLESVMSKSGEVDVD
ncbi:hypothetical protein [Gimesia aquarii]|uniref:Uncharacterized protein n=1 Tax=Gimesia aquarii TaxID=2527964 RepID=A0A517X170_9PLAN|nr:hypothetical protein [Gimesia aquarii]QDU11257.1 hypothetical protein V202x_46760 [Gimesia aquarii]